MVGHQLPKLRMRVRFPSPAPLLGVFLLCVSAFAGAQSVVPDAGVAASRPNAGGAPDEILVRLGLLDIVGIEDREKLFTVDLYVESEWHDPRLALPDSDSASLRTLPLSDIWTPRLTIINNRGLDSLLPEVATIDEEGNVIARLRLAGPLAVDLELRDFPFDTQRLPIEIVSYQYSPDEIIFSGRSEFIANLEALSGDGWDYTSGGSEPIVYRLKDDGRGAAGLTFAVLAERDATFYMLTLALPMTLILFLAWMAHWLPVELVPPRMGTASASVFSLIALGVSFRLTLPRITYLTVADFFGLFATLLVLVSLAVTVVTVRWANSERKDAAERLAMRGRIAFPILYGLIVVLTLSG